MLKPIITVCILSVAMPTFSYQCSEYSVNETYLQFTDPDPTNLRIADIGTTIVLLCCAVNYDNITWYFKDQVYPHWNISKKQLANNVHLVQGGQALQIYEVVYEMEGNYTCVITNDEGDSLAYNQTMWVKPLQTGMMFPTQEPDCVNKSARIGENITFYCKFFTGESEICPSVIWQRNETTVLYLFGFEFFFGPYSNFTSFVVETGPCPDGDVKTIGAALHIYNVSDDAYGLFTLQLVRETTVSMTFELSKIYDPPVNAQPNVIEHGSTRVAIMLGATLVSLFVLSLLYMYFKTDLHLMYKHYFEKGATEDLKEFDAFISHSSSDKDRQFAISQLKQFLENLGYNICVDEINFPAGEVHSVNSVNAVKCSRCCILVLSPDYLQRQSCTFEFSKALQNHKQKKNIIPVMFRSISPDSLSKQEALQHIIKAGEVLKWKSNGANKTFWKKLEVRMPPRRPSAIMKKQNQYIDRSTSTNSTAFLVPVRSDSKDSAISNSFPDDQADDFLNQKCMSPV